MSLIMFILGAAVGAYFSEQVRAVIGAIIRKFKGNPLQ